MLKKLIIILIPFISFSQSNENQDIYPFLSVDTPPLFTNCINELEAEQKNCFQESLNKHIRDNLKFPEESFDSKEGGRVFVNISFNKRGVTSNITTRGPNKILENEVIRVIKLLPDLLPGKKDGEDVNVSYALPVDFFLLSQFNYNEITIKKGSYVYESPDTKSNILLFTTEELLLNATEKEDFWLVEINSDGSYVGYVFKDDIQRINDSPREKLNLNDVKPKYLSAKISKVSEANDEIIDLSNEIKDDIDKYTKDEITVIKNLPLSEKELINLKLENDLDNLSFFKQKLVFQKEINRKIDGYNDSDLYYTSALKKFVDILEKDIELKYTLLSLGNPEPFNNTIFEVKKIKLTQKKVQKLNNERGTISSKFIQKNFYNFPLNSDIERLNELINGLKKLEYIIDKDIEIANIINENNLSNITIDLITEKKEPEIILVDNFSEQVLNKEKSKISLSDDLIEDGNLNNTVQIKSPTELYVKSTVVNDYGISGLRTETKEVYTKIQNTPDKRNIKTTTVKPSQENIVEKNNDNKVSLENYQLSVNEAKEKLNQLTSLYNQDLISKELYEESSTKFKEIIQSESQVSVDEAKEKLKQLTSLYNQDLISKELYEESSTKFKLIIEIDSINKLKSIEIPDITDDEALERIKTLKSLYDQKLIDKETYDSSTEILKKIILGN